MGLEQLNEQDRGFYDAGQLESMTNEGLEIVAAKERRNAVKATLPKPSKLESAARGIGQGLTLNFSDEIIAGLKSLGDKTYEQALEQERTKEELAREENPMTYLGGELGGGIASTFAPGVGLGKLKLLGKAIPKLGAYAQRVGTAVPSIKNAADMVNITKLKHIGNLVPALGKAATVSALQSAGATIGQSEDKMSEDLMRDATKSALVGAGTGVAGEGLGIMAKLAAPKVAVSALGATGKEVEKKLKPQVGEYLLKNKLIKFSDTPEDIAERVYNKYQVTSEKIGKSLKKVDDLDKNEVVRAFEAKINSLNPMKDQESIALLKSKIDEFSQYKDKISADELWDIKKGYDSRAKWNSQVQTYGYPQGYKDAGEVIRRAIAKKAQAQSPELAKDLAHAKKEFGMLYELNAATQRESARLGQRKIGGLLDMASGAGGATLGAGVGLLGASQVSSSKDLTDPVNLLGAGIGIGASRILAPRLGSSISRTLNSPGFQNVLRGGVPALQRSTYKRMVDGE